jgi:hypothetical protein
MDRRRFNHHCHALARRGLLRLLTALPLGVALPAWRDAAVGRRWRRLHGQHKHKKDCAKSGQKPKKGKKCCPGLTKDGSRRCAQLASGCVPTTCAPTACGAIPDGCGGTLDCGCAATSLCLSQTCQPCDVCPSGCPFSLVQDAITAAVPAATIRICAGTYSEDLTINKNLTLIGAGDGAGAGNSILHGVGTASVVTIPGGSTISLQRLRITGGNAGSGGGIVTGNVINGSTVSLTACTVAGNAAAFGGGIANFGTLTLTDSTVSGNTAADLGGGIYNSNGDTVTLDASSRITGNQADPNDPDSGGIHNFGGAVTLSSTDIVTGNTPDNCGGTAVPLCAS